ncbi:hypothetical protein B0J13DRAFT_42182 [Dactylonectria estremocensis]|uniref:Zn(2)-C6 fungal-type domain-containing protein n=1 Tax=Dactylonectria estremocensis TaxID=1079267 RepID=A0A9P9EU11_9HYPO|nr:hypothetical protein B0J13DRAFT_42182 [Dactylonectria estremocensis]
MVGVAGRSIACHTCKQRKIRCGGEKPTCSNCIKSGRSCAGYQRSHAFILSQYAVATNTELSDTGFRLVDRNDPSPVLLSRWKRNLPDRSAIPSSRRRHLNRNITSPSPLVSMSPHNAFRDQLLHLFINGQYPSDVISHALVGPHRKWLLRLGSLPSLSPALEYTILAVCTAWLGRRDKHVDLERKSLTLYTTGLRKLQRAIDSPTTQHDEQTLTACMALCMYEFTNCPGRTIEAYINHYHGAMELLRLRGAKAHSQGLSHGVFQALRMHAIFHGLGQRQATFLAQPEWIEKPWETTPKDHHDLLMDLFLQLPSILSKIDALDNDDRPQQVAAGCAGILQGCLRFESNLGTWLSVFRVAAAGPLYWPELSTTASETDSPELGKLFPVSMCFPSFRVAETMVLFWTLRVLLHFHAYKIQQKLYAAQETVSEYYDETHGMSQYVVVDMTAQHFPPAEVLLPPLGHQEESYQTSARYICQSVEYVSRIKPRNLGPNTMLPSLVVVRAILSIAPGDWARELAWVNETLSRIQQMGTQLVGCI